MSAPLWIACVLVALATLWFYLELWGATRPIPRWVQLLQMSRLSVRAAYAEIGLQLLDRMQEFAERMHDLDDRLSGAEWTDEEDER